MVRGEESTELEPGGRHSRAGQARVRTKPGSCRWVGVGSHRGRSASRHGPSESRAIRRPLSRQRRSHSAFKGCRFFLAEATMTCRTDNTQTSHAGITLIEILLAVVLMGLVGGSVLTAMGTAAESSFTHRGTAGSQSVLASASGTSPDRPPRMCRVRRVRRRGARRLPAGHRRRVCRLRSDRSHGLGRPTGEVLERK